MDQRSRIPWLLGALITAAVMVAGSSTPLFAGHHVFSSSMDRFEIDGNAFGPFDGTIDFFDEFDNGTIAPDWAPLLGTNVESGNVVTFQNPGFDIVIGTAAFDVSNIENETAIEDGLGNATATSYWVPTLPNPGADFHFQLYGVGGIIESAGLSVGNGTAGPFITEQLSQIIFPTSFTNLISETVLINPLDITGQIVLRLSVNDASNTATSSFSLDGGTTFQSPFSPMPIFSAVSDYEVLAGAGVVEEATVGPTPTPTPPPAPQMVGAKLLLVKNPGAPASRKVIYKVKQLGPTLAGDPYYFGASFALNIDGQFQCFSMPSFLWTPKSYGFKYRDQYGTYGPIKSAQIKYSNGTFQIKVIILGKNGAINVVPPNPGAQANTNFSAGGAEYCSSSTGAVINPNSAKVFKVKNAPPPAMCNIPACP